VQGEPQGWRPAAHHFGWYTFDNCDRVSCDDPTHFVDEGDEGLMEIAVEQSRLREAKRAEEWVASQKK
jgi:hypothetical protein